MTDPSKLIATQAEHGMGIKQLDKKVETLYTLHNGPVTESMKQVERIAEAVTKATESVDKLSKRIDESDEKLNERIHSIRETQLVCAAQRAQELKSKEGAMKKVAHYGAITVILTFVGGLLLTMYKFLEAMIAKGAH